MNLYRTSYKKPDNDHWVFCDVISIKERVLSSAKNLTIFTFFHIRNLLFKIIIQLTCINHDRI